MIISRIFRYASIAGVCFIVFTCGCAKEAQTPQAVTAKPAEAAKQSKPKAGAFKLSLKPAVGQQTSYKVMTKAHRDIKWEGPVPQKSNFEPSYNEETVEMTVTERIQKVDPNGQALAEVTIDSLKYIAVVKNNTNVDFDSSRQSDANNILTRLIGKSYTIEFGPDNAISSISGLDTLKAMFQGHTSGDRAGNSILSNEAVTERHSALVLPPAGSERLNTGDTWSRIKTFTFGLMGLKSYEKIYKLGVVQDAAGHQIAVIDMNAIPSSEVESKYKNQQAGANFPKMFDTNDIYTGSGEVDLTAGAIDKYSENLRAHWIAALPPNPGETPDANGPVMLLMTATRSCSIETVK